MTKTRKVITVKSTISCILLRKKRKAEAERTCGVVGKSSHENLRECRVLLCYSWSSHFVYRIESTQLQRRLNK